MAVSETYLKRGLGACKQAKRGLFLPLGIDLKYFDNQIKLDNFFLKKNDKEIWLIYIGTMGKTNDLDTILKGAKNLLNQQNIKILFAGGWTRLFADQKYRGAERLEKRHIYRHVKLFKSCSFA